MYEEKIRMLRNLANGDKTYRQIKQRYREQEEAFSRTAALLSNELQDILWAFVITSDELDRRLIEIACDYICFDCTDPTL